MWKTKPEKCRPRDGDTNNNGSNNTSSRRGPRLSLGRVGGDILNNAGEFFQMKVASPLRNSVMASVSKLSRPNDDSNRYGTGGRTRTTSSPSASLSSSGRGKRVREAGTCSRLSHNSRYYESENDQISNDEELAHELHDQWNSNPANGYSDNKISIEGSLRRATKENSIINLAGSDDDTDVETTSPSKQTFGDTAAAAASSKSAAVKRPREDTKQEKKDERAGTFRTDVDLTDDPTEGYDVFHRSTSTKFKSKKHKLIDDSPWDQELQQQQKKKNSGPLNSSLSFVAALSSSSSYIARKRSNEDKVDFYEQSEDTVVTHPQRQHHCCATESKLADHENRYDGTKPADKDQNDGFDRDFFNEKEWPSDEAVFDPEGVYDDDEKKEASGCRSSTASDRLQNGNIHIRNKTFGPRGPSHATAPTTTASNGSKLVVPKLKCSQVHGQLFRKALVSTSLRANAPEGTPIDYAREVDLAHGSTERHLSSQAAERLTGGIDQPNQSRRVESKLLFSSTFTSSLADQPKSNDNKIFRLSKENHGGASSGGQKKKRKNTLVIPGDAIKNANASEQRDCIQNQDASNSHDVVTIRTWKEKSEDYDGDDDCATNDENDDELTYRAPTSRRSQTQKSDSISRRGTALPATAKQGDDDFETLYEETKFVPSPRNRRRDSLGDRRSRSSSKKKASPEVVEIDSTDSENEDDDEMKINLKRISYHREGGSKWQKCRERCFVSFNEETTTMTLYSTQLSGGSVRFSLVPGAFKRISYVDSETLLTIANNGQSDQVTRTREFDHAAKLFIELLYPPSGFENFESPKRGPVDDSTFLVVLDFLDEDDLQNLKEGIEASQIAPEIETEEAVLAYFDEVGENSRKAKDFDHGRKKDEIILVYPFPGYRQSSLDQAIIHDLRKEFKLAGDKTDAGRGEARHGIVDAAAQSRQRAHHVVIRIKDYERLKGRQWLNDSLVDFYMQWLTRQNEDLDNSNVHIFTSHFYSTLRDEGSQSVQSWTEKKNINIFKKKLVFIPINESLHWSLCVLVNPGAVENINIECEKRSKEKYSCMIFMDSLRMHDSNDVKRNIYRWLNREWKRLKAGESAAGRSSIDKEKKGERVFDLSSFPCHSPEVPRQRNGCDCGVFVCRYAYSIYPLVGMDLTWGAVFARDVKTLFQDYVEKYFDFDRETIKSIRKDFMELLKRLSHAYEDSKKSEKAEKKRRAIDNEPDEPSSGDNAIDGEELDGVQKHLGDCSLGTELSLGGGSPASSHLHADI